MTFYLDAAHTIMPAFSTRDILAMDWGKSQMASTHNVTHGRLLNFVTYGAVMQIEHHLFPTLSHLHFPEMRPIIQEVCQKYGVEYKEFDGLAEWLPHRMRYLEGL